MLSDVLTTNPICMDILENLHSPSESISMKYVQREKMSQPQKPLLNNKQGTKPKVLAIASYGGHWVQLREILNFPEHQQSVVWVTTSQNVTEVPNILK